MDTKPLVSSFGYASATYTLVSAKGNIDPIPVPCSARATLEDPIDGSEWRLAMETEVKDKLETDFTTVSNVCDLTAALEDPITGSKWRLAMETEIEGELEVDFTTMPNVSNSTIDDFTLRIAIYVDNMLVGNEVTPQDKDLRTTFVADSSKRLDFEVMGMLRASST